MPLITAYLFHAGGHEDPAHFHANKDRSFEGVKVYGMGFTFDDTDTQGIATPLAEMERLIRENSRNQERIFPYIGGEEINTSPTHAYHRYVINFEDWPLKRSNLNRLWKDAGEEERNAWLREGVVPLDYPDSVAADFPDLLKIVEAKVKPERLAQKDKYGQKLWWRHLRTRPELRRTSRGLARVLVISRVGNAFGFAFLPTGVIVSDRTVVLPLQTNAAFAVLQSRVHEAWARFLGSSLKDDLLYTHSDCVGTFPFPSGFEASEALESIGSTYYAFRAELMRGESRD